MKLGLEHKQCFCCFLGSPRSLICYILLHLAENPLAGCTCTGWSLSLLSHLQCPYIWKRWSNHIPQTKNCVLLCLNSVWHHKTDFGTEKCSLEIQKFSCMTMAKTHKKHHQIVRNTPKESAQAWCQASNLHWHGGYLNGFRINEFKSSNRINQNPKFLIGEFKLIVLGDKYKTLYS